MDKDFIDIALTPNAACLNDTALLRASREDPQQIGMKNTPMGRAPQVKREHRDETRDVLNRTNKRSLVAQNDAAYSISSPPTSPESIASPSSPILDQQLLCDDANAQLQQNGALMGSSVDIKFRPPRKAPVGGKWTEEEDQRLREIVEMYGAKNWKRLASILGNVRSDVQCLHRWNKVLRPGLSKGPWTAEEDKIVKNMVLKHGAGNIKWSVIAAQLPGRIGKQCRERWFNHLDPEIKKGDWTPEEDNILFETQRIHGNRWSEIAKLLPGRTENAVKNRWNSSARKRWLRENGLSEASDAAKCRAALGNGLSTATLSDAAAPASSPSLPLHIRPPALSLPSGMDQDCRSKVNSPITQLLDQDQNGLLEAGGILDVSDSVDLLAAFDDDKGDAVESSVGEARQLTSPIEGQSDLRASDEIDFSKPVDYLGMDPFATDNSAAVNSSYKQDELRTSGQRHHYASFTSSGAFEGSHVKSVCTIPLEGTNAALSMMPPSADNMAMTSSFDSGLQAALNGVMPSASTTIMATAATISHMPSTTVQPVIAKADAPMEGHRDSCTEDTRPLTEQLQRAATMAVERIVAASSEKEVPLTMLPYFQFLNERGRQSIMNQLMAQFSHTAISSHQDDNTVLGGDAIVHPSPIDPRITAHHQRAKDEHVH